MSQPSVTLPDIQVATTDAVVLDGHKSRPCQACPWLRSNWGKTDTAHPEYNTAELREELWDKRPGLRFGNQMLCHLSDTRRCAGVTVLHHREVLRFQQHGPKALAPAALHGLTFESMMVVAARMFGVALHTSARSIKRRVLLGAAHPAIADPAIGHHHLDPPAPGEFDADESRDDG